MKIYNLEELADTIKSLLSNNYSVEIEKDIITISYERGVGAQVGYLPSYTGDILIQERLVNVDGLFDDRKRELIEEFKREHRPVLQEMGRNLESKIQPNSVTYVTTSIII
nr:hypothetical protein [uncultured archaeon]